MTNYLMTYAEYHKFRDLFYKKTGIFLEDSRFSFSQARVGDRMFDNNMPQFQTYLSELILNKDELQILINLFTVNETYFYRELYQFECLVDYLLEERISQLKEKEVIRIWSVPCATGEEPYSLCMYLLENWSRINDYDVEIIASDIDTNALEIAQEGVYLQRSLMELSPHLVNRYFKKVNQWNYKLSDEIMDAVQFSLINIVDQHQVRKHGQFDVIFCRNVLIYFDDKSRKLATTHLHQALKSGGFLCLGHAEFMSRFNNDMFITRKYGSTYIYQK